MPAVSNNKITLSEDQQKANDQMIQFMHDRGDIFTLGGYAGTGKTTILGYTMREFRAQLRKEQGSVSIGYCCYTGKAADVLRKKLRAVDAIGPNDYCGTIHGMIYKPIPGSDPVEFIRQENLEHDMILIDEASMVNKEILQDLQSYGVPIVAIGDHGQLPPIKGSFNLMEKPDFRLEKIHRQAADNPIIKLSMLAREEGKIPFGTFSKGVWKARCKRVDIFKKLLDMGKLFDAMVLCGYNKSRVDMNYQIRRMLGQDKNYPVPKEKVICLRNNRNRMIFNGMIGTLKAIKPVDNLRYWATAEMDGRDVSMHMSIPQFGNPKTIDPNPMGYRGKQYAAIELFDWAYALTVWKAQGSECPVVVVFEQRNKYMDDDTWRRWLYTAVTRSSKELYVVEETRQWG